MDKNNPMALPVQIGVGEHGFNANVLYDANGESLATLYGIPQSTTINELRQLSLQHPDMWSDGLRKAEFIMRACNSHAQLVAALKAARKEMLTHPDILVIAATVERIDVALFAAEAK